MSVKPEVVLLNWRKSFNIKCIKFWRYEVDSIKVGVLIATTHGLSIGIMIFDL